MTNRQQTIENLVNEKAQEIIEFFWDEWYGRKRGEMNSDEMSDLLSLVKALITTEFQHLSRESEHLPALVEALEIIRDMAKDFRPNTHTYNTFIRTAEETLAALPPHLRGL